MISNSSMIGSMVNVENESREQGLPIFPRKIMTVKGRGILLTSSTRSVSSSLSLLKKFDGTWKLEKGNGYIIITRDKITIPPGHCGFIFLNHEASCAGIVSSPVFLDPTFNGFPVISIIPGNTVYISETFPVARLYLFENDSGDKFLEGKTVAWISATETHAQYIIEGRDGIVAFPVPEKTPRKKAMMLAIVKLLKSEKTRNIEIHCGFDPLEQDGAMPAIIEGLCKNRIVKFK